MVDQWRPITVANWNYSLEPPMRCQLCLIIHRYANKGSIMKAIADFELALDNCPDHRNAKKYLCQTLVERGRQ